MPDDNHTKRCPVCRRLFTRQELKLNENQWFLRVYCGRRCYFKGRNKTR